MTASLAHILADSPILTLFLVIGLGYLLGQISFFGFRLGVAGVLFSGLAVGALGPTIALPEAIPNLGLIIFVYTVGIETGPAFWRSFRQHGYRHTVVCAIVLVFAFAVTFGMGAALHLSKPRTAGLYTGALTNTPALAAVRERLRDRGRAHHLSEDQIRDLSSEPVVAYSISYPLGVIGVLLCIQIARRFWFHNFQPAEEQPEIHVHNFAVTNGAVAGLSVGELMQMHRNSGFVISRIQHAGRVNLAQPETVLAEGDVVAIVGDDKSSERARLIFGEPIDAHLEEDRSQLDFRRVFVSNKEVVGRPIGKLDLDRLSATITRVRRGDVDVVPDPETRLEFGDRIRVLTRRENFAAVSKLFGDSIRGTAETDFGSVALGMVLGVMAGMLPIPLPGGVTVRLGLAGGPLVVALILGRIERTGGIAWVMPISANLTLRQIGLLLFLAGVGTKAGFAFVQTMRSNGAQMLVAGALVTFSTTLLTLLVGYKLLKIPPDSILGFVAGVQTQPACLAFASNLTKSENTNIAYASIYPAAMIVKIILAQLLV
ncbi:MAG: transporter [Acidobacteriia bacterium]|nr:transporter [Terriglobia bacterium]